MLPMTKSTKFKKCFLGLGATLSLYIIIYSLDNMARSTSSVIKFEINKLEGPKPITNLLDISKVHLYIDDVIKNYHKEADRDPECREVAANPRAWWRTQYLNDTFSHEEDNTRIGKATQCGGYMTSEYLKAPPYQRLYPFEEEYLNDGPLTNVKEATSETYSTIQVVNERATYNLGDRVEILIQARDGLNRSKTRGGDEIRAWLITEVNSAVKNRVAATVVDLKNGSYLATALLPWAGKVRLFVALAYSREFMRALAFVFFTTKNSRHISGRFENNKASETTPCYHFPVVPSFSPDELCNLTWLNGSPWFCGRPQKKSLSCKDHRFSRVSISTKFMPVTDAEKLLLENAYRRKNAIIISSNTFFTVTHKPGTADRLLTPKQPCHSVKPKTTWTYEEPRGYFYRGQWQSLICTGHQLAMRECLRNKNIVILGDSNARSHFQQLTVALKCKHMLPWPTKAWHAPLLCVGNDTNTQVSWNPHSQPFHSYSDRWSQDMNMISSALTIDKLPFDHREHWVILHHYIHLTFHHLSVFEAKYRSLKEAIQRLLVRRPNVRILIQGAHTMWGVLGDNYLAGDRMGNPITQLLKEIFQDLQDRVFFVSFWDWTIAMENVLSHPHLPEQLSQEVFRYLCDK